MKNYPRWAGQVRHILTAVGVYLVATQKVDEGTWAEIVGGVMAIIGFVWSWMAPEKKEAG